MKWVDAEARVADLEAEQAKERTALLAWADAYRNSAKYLLRWQRAVARVADLDAELERANVELERLRRIESEASAYIYALRDNGVADSSSLRAALRPRRSAPRTYSAAPEGETE